MFKHHHSGAHLKCWGCWDIDMCKNILNLIFYLGKKGRKPACLRDVGPGFGCGGPASSCCLLPLPSGSCCLAFALQEVFQLFLTLRGKLQRKLTYFKEYWHHFCFSMCHAQAKDRAGSGHCPPWMNHMWEEGWKRLMAAAPREQGRGSPAPSSAWHIVLSPNCPWRGAPSHHSPPSGALDAKDAPAVPGLSWAPWVAFCILQGPVQGLGSSSHWEGRNLALPIPCRGVWLHPDARPTKWLQLPKKKKKKS